MYIKSGLLWLALLLNAASLNAQRLKGGRGGVKIRLPFSEKTGVESLELPTIFGKSADINLPFSSFPTPKLGGLSQRLKARPVLRVVGQEEERILGGARDRASEEPRGVINLPFAQFNLPFTTISEQRQELPSFAHAQRAAAAGANRAPSAPFSGPARSLQQRTSLVSQGSRKGNLDGDPVTKVGNVSPAIPVPNKLTLPYSILNFPLSALDLPLEKVLLPFSNINNLPGGLPLSAGVPAAPLFRALSDDPLNDPSFPSLLAEAESALQAPNAVNLNSFSLPYSFLNNPLSFFNLPLSYVNLPFGSTNLPLGHLNLPFGFFNLPFFELIQTFGAPLGGARSPDDPVDVLSQTRELTQPLSTQAPNSDSYREKLQIVPKVKPKRRIVVESVDLGGLELMQEELGRFITHFAGRGEASSGPPSTPKPMVVANSFLRSALGTVEPSDAALPSLPPPDERAKEVFGRFSRVLRDALPQPSVPELGGLIGLENSLFTTPFSLFNLPLGFLDLPTGFLNLPLSHFNLPLSHLTLPFASLALPIDDIATPELNQNIFNASVELADIPPSLLELLNPENPLQSYLNLPLSELNLPLAVLDMPFAVFDMPFAFLNMPVGHLNSPFTHLHLPFEVSSLPLAEIGLPFESFIAYPTSK